MSKLIVHGLFIVFVAEADVIESLIPPLLRAGNPFKCKVQAENF
jgi:hypothetical protein